VGDYTTLAGQVGVAGHLRIGDHVTMYARAGVTKDVLEAGSYTGFPAKPIQEGRRLMTYPTKVPEILKRLREVEARLKELEGEKPGP
jgi:UDP-3-O-[3-hydroxymyristoyl] glucosamine N-acyltransferase